MECHTADGRNPAPPGMKKETCKQWDKLSTSTSERLISSMNSRAFGRCWGDGENSQVVGISWDAGYVQNCFIDVDEEKSDAGPFTVGVGSQDVYFTWHTDMTHRKKHMSNEKNISCT